MHVHRICVFLKFLKWGMTCERAMHPSEGTFCVCSEGCRVNMRFLKTPANLGRDFNTCFSSQGFKSCDIVRTVKDCPRNIILEEGIGCQWRNVATAAVFPVRYKHFTHKLNYLPEISAIPHLTRYVCYNGSKVTALNAGFPLKGTAGIL